MKRISNEEVKKVAELARLELNESEIQHHAEQLEKILDYINQLEKINTENIPHYKGYRGSKCNEKR